MKNILFCADGTWNGPGEDDADIITNVLKLFQALGGDASDGARLKDEQEKTLEQNGTVAQVAKYIHGVGDSRNKMVRLIGGAFGSGTITRIVRGLTFISRHYAAGDRITIVGFSRGAYTARALAGMIAVQGLLKPGLDPETAYRQGAEAWYRYRKATKSGSVLTRFVEGFADLPAFVSREKLKDSDLVPIDGIHAVGVWDTVGALGFPAFAAKGERLDLFEFTNNELHPHVANGFHAVALDEQRNDFAPSLWKDRAGVEQVLFPGAHADCGGGYPVTGNESGLSDNALLWMVGKLEGVGVQFDRARLKVAPRADGVAHQPWAHSPWNLPGVFLGDRQFKGVATLGVDPMVAARAAVAGGVVGEPGKAAKPYAPKNLP